MLKKVYICLFGLGWLMVACQPASPVWPTPDAVVEQAVLTQMAAMPRPTLYPAMDITGTPVSTTSPSSPEVLTIPAPIQTPADAYNLAGLVFDAGTLVQVAEDGSLIQWYDRPVDILSADGNYTLTSGNGDYWMYDLTTKKLVKLTDTATRNECCAVWWAGHPDKILMLSSSVNAASGVATRGYLTVIRMDGSGYMVLDPEHPTTGTPAVSPDGIWIAYGIGETGWLFGGEQEPIPFDPRDYGLESLKGQRISHPSWSPDGTKIAWYWQSVLNVGSRMGVVIFDLVNKTYQLGNLVEPSTDEPPIYAPKWSPDGLWLAYSIDARLPEESGTWVMRVDGQANQVLHLGGAELIPGAWSPDGKFLALSSVVGSTDQSGIWLADTSNWEMSLVDMPGMIPGRIYLWK
jgi:Tol biopolymer transport system component